MYALRERWPILAEGSSLRQGYGWQSRAPAFAKATTGKAEHRAQGLDGRRNTEEIIDLHEHLKRSYFAQQDDWNRPG